jgi:hypothetical protein
MSYNSSSAFLGSGLVLSHCATSTGTYVPFAEIRSMTSSKRAVPKIKVTNMESLNFTHEFIPGFIDPGEYEVECNMTDTDYLIISGLVRSPMFFKAIYPNKVTTAGTTKAFAGWVSELSEKSDPENEVTHSFKLTVTGAETITAAT